jgi:omega-hydroxy-beta-dihydromenaquinone-9 sulfotransferase
MTDSDGPDVTNPVPLLGGRALLRWIDSGGPFDRHATLHGLRLRWAAIWFEHYLKLTSDRCAETELPSPIIFILGLWRSGTTALHNALEEATGWTTPRTWQCFRPADFLLAPEPRNVQASRPMDEGRIGTFTPQEDEFAALLLGEHSVYRAFLDPRRFEELSPLLGEWRKPLNPILPPLSSRWEVFLKAVSQRKSGPLLLKSPNHTFRLPWLAQRFQAAQFIWLTRPKADVMASNLRMWTAMIERYSLWRGDARMLQQFLHDAVANHDEVLDWARTAIPDRIHFVRFDRVISDRASMVTNLLVKLDLAKKES